MISFLHRLRRDEEGQALVLAAVFALVLMLCVLSTVNLGRSIYEKVQLQNAADAAAYSHATAEARVLNFTAYTNRAMVVHYASILAASAYLAWAHFLWAGMGPLLRIVRMVPSAGPAFAAIEQMGRALIRLLDSAVALLTPMLSAANVVLWGLQEGAWAAAGSRLSRIAPEAHSGDSARAPYRELWPELTHAANRAVFARTRGKATLSEDAAQSARILVNHRDPAVQLARAHMLEVANSARSAWVAYGDRWDRPSPSPLARHARWRLPCPILGGSVAFRVVARTEVGGMPPDGSSSSTTNAQVFSGQRLEADVSCRGLRAETVSLFEIVTVDQAFATVPPFKSFEARAGGANGVLSAVLGHLLGGASSLARSAAARSSAPAPAERPFWLSPYVSFAPQARSVSGGLAGPLGNFAQPDVIVGLTTDGSPSVSGRRITSPFGGSVDFARSSGDRGVPLPGRGLHALAAGQAYYHRPGDWREMPNFFNPLWAARLMPIAESNAAAMIPGLARLPKLLH